MYPDVEWVDQDNKRHREKYYRLNYKEKHKPDCESKKMYNNAYYDKYPEKLRAKSKCLNEKREGFEKHHWSYKDGDEKDIIWLTKKEHATLHRYLKYNKKEFKYMDLKGNLLETKEKHISYYKLLKNILPF